MGDWSPACGGLDQSPPAAAKEVRMKLDYSKLRPLQDRVFVEKAKEFSEAPKIGHIYIPETTSITLREGKLGWVRAVGKGRSNKGGELIPHDIRVGDLVYYARYGNEKVWDDGGNMIIITQEPSLMARVHSANSDLGIVSITIGKIELRNDRMLCREVQGNETTKSGLVLPKQKIDPGEQMREFMVIKTGPGKMNYRTGERADTILQPGDTTWSAELNGVRISLWENGERVEYRLLAESDCHIYGR